jgi:hypothetical protein
MIPGHLGPDQVFCWLTPPGVAGAASASERIYAYYIPVIVLLGVNVVLMVATAYSKLLVLFLLCIFLNIVCL